MATKSPGKQVNRSGLAETFGVVTVTVDSWVKRGCPFVERGGRGKEWVFDTADIARWLRDQAVAEAGPEDADLDQIEKRTKRAKMTTAEVEAAKAQGLVAPIRDFERAMAAMCAQVRANCMNLPQRVVTQLLGETDEARFKSVLRAEVILALEATAGAALTLEQDDADTDPIDD